MLFEISLIFNIFSSNKFDIENDLKKGKYKMKKAKLIIILIAIFILQACNADKNPNQFERKYDGPKPKYIFMFIGDGMGISQINSAEVYLSSLKDSIYSKKLTMSNFPVQGIYTTYAEDRYITSSAAGGTALATGKKTTINTVSMTGNRKFDMETVAEIAHKKGMKVGIVTSVSLNHATPAVFYAHQPTRSMYYKIGLDMANSNFNYFGGGGIRDSFGEKMVTSMAYGTEELKNVDSKKKSVFEFAEENGYKVTRDKEAFKKLNKDDNKVIAISPRLCDDKSIFYALDQNKTDVSLPEFTSKGIELLDNSKGFFMMVEGGKIDWACHENDASTVIHEILQFDKSIAEAVKFYKKHPKETLIIVVADHETGGMTLGFAGTRYRTDYKKLKNQNISYKKFSDIIESYRDDHTVYDFKYGLALIRKHFGLGDESKGLALTDFEISQLKDAFERSMLVKKDRKKSDEIFLKYGYYDPFSVTATHILAQKAGISWTTYSHTGVPVSVKAIGMGQELFSGYFDNTDIGKNIKYLLK